MLQFKTCIRCICILIQIVSLPVRSGSSNELVKQSDAVNLNIEGELSTSNGCSVDEFSCSKSILYYPIMLCPVENFASIMVKLHSRVKELQFVLATQSRIAMNNSCGDYSSQRSLKSSNIHLSKL